MRIRIPHLSAAALALLPLVSPTLQAADYKFGAQIGLATPTGDLKTLTDSNLGLGLGLHMLIDFGNGQVLRPRLEGTVFKTDNVTLVTTQGTAAITGHVALSSLGADYLYFFDGDIDRSAYLLAGAGISTNTISIDLKVAGLDATVSRDDTKPYFAVGGGYQFNRRFGAEARYEMTQWQNSAALLPTQQLGRISAMAMFRF